MDGPPAFDMEMLEPWAEPSPRRVRVRAGDVLLAESDRAQILVRYGPDGLPTYCLPEEDVRTDLLGPGSPHAAAATRFDEAPHGIASLAGTWTFSWDGTVQWFEEATEVHVHARDPRKRVDTLWSDRHVRVEIGGQLLAESRRPLALFETGLPTRWYLPPEDVIAELLPTDTVSRCPYKGTARFFSTAGVRDVAWSYPDPIPENPRIRGLIAFFNERVDLTLDGIPQRRPFTVWSLDATA